VGGNIMFSLGYVFLHRSMASFFGRGAAESRIQWMLAAAAAVAMVQYGLLRPDTSRRLIALSIVLAAQLAITASFVFRNTPSYMRSAGWVMGAVLALLAAGNLVRLAGLIIHGAPRNYLNGGPVLAWTVVNTSVLQGGIIVAFVWMTAARLHHELEVQAMTDPLTGLFNRRGIEILAERIIASSERSLSRVSAILFDLDNFKQINDSFGHLCGDAALTAVAQCLKREIRAADTLARLGGDEFALLLNATGIEDAQSLAERLRIAIEQLCVRYDNSEISVTASFGVAELRDSSQGWQELMLQCDRALYAVKGGGGNLVIADSRAI
jgi:diguanylate cyclase (GGDEF)-like protein